MRFSSLVAAAVFLVPHFAIAQDDGEDGEGAWAEGAPDSVVEPQDHGSADENAPSPLPPPERPPTLRDFEQSLSPYGQWVDVPGLGRVWKPDAQIVGQDFVPYVTGGQWVRAPSGWQFRTGWNWGWAPFHYGRWHQAAGLGWVWWPSYTWGPSWVEWRGSRASVAWAPLPPPGFRMRFGFGAPGWSFSSRHHFHRPWRNRHIYPPGWHAPRHGGWPRPPPPPRWQGPSRHSKRNHHGGPRK